MRIYLHWKCWPSLSLSLPRPSPFLSLYPICVCVRFLFFACTPKKKNENKKNSKVRREFCVQINYVIFVQVFFLDLGRCVWREWTFQGETRKNSQSENKENVGRGNLQKNKRTGTSVPLCVCVCVCFGAFAVVCVCAGERVIGIESTRTVPTRMWAIPNAQLEIISSNRYLYIKSRYNYGYLMIVNCSWNHDTFKFLYTCNTWRMINLRKTTLRMISFSVRWCSIYFSVGDYKEESSLASWWRMEDGRRWRPRTEQQE